MKTKVIAVISQKGGVGKSTLARSLAVRLRQACPGKTVKLADLDKGQETSKKWTEKRKELSCVYTDVDCQIYSNVETALIGQSEYDFIILDCPPRVSSETKKIVEAADIVLLPSNTSDDSLDPTLKIMLQLVKNHGVSSNKLCLVLMGLLSDSEHSKIYDWLTAKQVNLNVLNDYLLIQKGYELALSQGRTVFETSYPSLNIKGKQFIDEIIRVIKI